MLIVWVKNLQIEWKAVGQGCQTDMHKQRDTCGLRLLLITTVIIDLN